MRKIPISCSGSDDELANRYGYFTVPKLNEILPKKTKKEKTQTPLHTHLPVYASVWRFAALPNLPAAENVD
jgi:hypothetical protein